MTLNEVLQQLTNLTATVEMLIKKEKDTELSKPSVQRILEKYVTPIVKAAYTKYPRYRGTIGVWCGQYYNDEANDAVHLKFTSMIFNNEFLDTSASTHHNLKTEFYELKSIYTDIPCIFSAHQVLDNTYPDNFEDFIQALAPFCPPGGNQDNDMEDNYGLLAIYRTDLTYDIVSQKEQDEIPF